MRVDSDDHDHVFVHFAPGYAGEEEKDRKKIPWRNDNAFLYQRRGDKISFSIGDQELEQLGCL